MKQIISFLLLSIFLASCANTETPTPNVTATSEATVTFTSAPTEIPSTATPDISKTPAPTVDPSAPEGVSGVDSQGNQIVTMENGDIFRKIDVLGWQGWVTSKTPEGIPLIDWINTMEGYERDIGVINLFVSSSVLGNESIPQFTHTNKTEANMNDHDLTSRLIVTIFNRTNNGANPTNDLSWKQDLLLQEGKVPIGIFIENSGEEQFWNISPDTGLNVILTDWDSLVGAPEFFLHGIPCRAKILGLDEKGVPVGIIAVQVPLNTLTEDMWWRIILQPAANIIDHPDQTIQDDTETLESWIAFADNKNPDTWIVQVPNK